MSQPEPILTPEELAESDAIMRHIETHPEAVSLTYPEMIAAIEAERAALIAAAEQRREAYGNVISIRKESPR